MSEENETNVTPNQCAHKQNQLMRSMSCVHSMKKKTERNTSAWNTQTKSAKKNQEKNQIKNKMFLCSFCFDHLHVEAPHNIRVLSCGHILHLDCIHNW